MSDRDTHLNDSLVLAAARDAVFAEYGEALNRHLTRSEIDEMIDERAIRILRKRTGERVAA